jgi:hypothetical protein
VSSSCWTRMIEVALAIATDWEDRPHRRTHSWAARVMGSKARRSGVGTLAG